MELSDGKLHKRKDHNEIAKKSDAMYCQNCDKIIRRKNSVVIASNPRVNTMTIKNSILGSIKDMLPPDSSRMREVSRFEARNESFDAAMMFDLNHYQVDAQHIIQIIISELNSIDSGSMLKDKSMRVCKDCHSDIMG